ncbi:MAG: ATP-binding cassette domain-containing protein [Myxococcales bacterium]|nr:ATP-binding cassette domain-containing protein [Myxococcales bacterium]
MLRNGLQVLGNLPMDRLLALSRSQWKILTVGTLFLLISSAAGLAYPQAVKWIFDGAFTSKDQATVDNAALAMLVIFLLQGIATALRSYLFTVAGERIVANLRRSLYDHLIAQEIAFFDETRTGELVSRLASDTQVLQNTVSVNVSMALRSLATLMGGIGLLLYTSPKLTAFMLLIVPPVALAAVYNGRRIRRYAKQTQEALARASEVAEETLSGIRTVRRFAAEPAESERYGAAVEESFRVSAKRAKFGAVFFGITSFSGYAAVALVVWYGGRMVIGGGMSVGELTSFVLYTLTVAISLGALGGLWADFMRAAGAAERVFSLLDRSPTIADGQGGSLSEVSGALRFSGVDFTYPSRPDIQILHNIDLQLAPGEVVALVGPSGGGKSTVGALISRLYDPDQGSVFLDDTNLRDLDPSWLRRQVGVVAQEPTLFSASVQDNIRYGRPDATEAEVIAAATAANAHGFISEFPEGYDTRVGERGVRLSGGQKQRVAIARALLKDPRILILDEATSALDAESEHLVKEALERLMHGRTTLVIAHRLSTVRDASHVGVIDSGHLKEWGTHAELIAQGGIYKRLVERQFVDA